MLKQLYIIFDIFIDSLFIVTLTCSRQPVKSSCTISLYILYLRSYIKNNNIFMGE